MGNHTGYHDSSVRATIKIIEDEVLELKQQELDLLTRLRLLQGTIARKFLLAAVQDWVDENNGADERAIVSLAYDGWCDGWEEDIDFSLPIALVFTISHVSHHWRQLVISAPSLWTHLVITPNLETHWDVFRDFFHRSSSMSIAANFRSFAPGGTLSSAELSLMEAIIPLIHAQHINKLVFLDSGPVCSFLLSRMVEQAAIGLQSLPSTVFSRLTALSIFSLVYPEGFTFSHLRQLLSAAPQLKTLELQYSGPFAAVELADKTAITFPMLENLTVIDSNQFVCKLLDSLSAPNVRRLKLLVWDDWAPGAIDVTSGLFIENNIHFNPGLRLPKFPKVQNLTLSSSRDYDRLNANLIHAFPRVTHLTLGSPSVFDEIEEPSSLAPPTFQCLQRLTLNFAFEDAEYMDLDLRNGFTCLRKPQDRADRRPLLISVFDRSYFTEKADKHLFQYYKELQRYREFDGSSSRLDAFMCWQADGEPEILA
ncbi:hypothetical protein BJ138DRAFT_1205939 [Hygrophoropsis aurantiaca]|uniref:Uncharacterized protein n=1 Tax=Hygrophoropsis aurantiaca TaxID=72124 RepID=A0ACB8A525_9AGAM|nr:hypothetical protein BJ138DRAFT_1205939 [Hygrophoropsis aurantiaca]